MTVCGRAFERGRGGERMVGRRWGRAGVYLFILIGSDSDELGLRESISPEGAEGELHYVVGPDDVKPELVFMHRVQNCLESQRHETHDSNYYRFVI